MPERNLDTADRSFFGPNLETLANGSPVSPRDPLSAHADGAGPAECTYAEAHRRIYAARGKASDPLCARCHGKATRPDWGEGYRHDPDLAREYRREWSKRTYEHQTATPEGRQAYRDRKNRERREHRGSVTGTLTTTELAKRVGVHRNTIIRWADDGQLSHTRTRGGYRQFPPDAVEVAQAILSDRTPERPSPEDTTTTKENHP